MSHAQLSGAKAYMDAVLTTLDRVMQDELEPIDRAVTSIVETIRKDGMIYLFGTGHSHMLAEEGHFRAGGIAPVCPILSASLMLHESASTGTKLERTTGLGPVILSRYNPSPDDVLVVFSNSGVNAVPVEIALAAKEIGMTVIAVVSLAYARQAPLSSLGKKLPDVADIVIDNHGPPGDALVEVSQTGLRAGPISTIAGAFILNAILVEAVARIAQEDQFLPVYISANIPGANEHNARLLSRYRTRNPHL